jgi:hypothetical protein
MDCACLEVWYSRKTQAFDRTLPYHRGQGRTATFLYVQDDLEKWTLQSHDRSCRAVRWLDEPIISWTRSNDGASRYSQFSLSFIASPFSVLGCSQHGSTGAEQGALATELLLTHTDCTMIWSPSEQFDSQPPQGTADDDRSSHSMFLDSFVLVDCQSI